jgi:hypothetical protein
MENQSNTLKIVHAEVIQEKGLSMQDLPSSIQKKIKGFNLMKNKFFQDTSNNKMKDSLNRETIKIADEIINYVDDNPINKKDIVDKDDIDSRVIDISDIAGVYNLSDMPSVIEKIQNRIEKVKNGERLFIATMEMSYHLRNALIVQFETLTELSSYTKKQVSTMQGMGVKVMDELEKLMEQHGIKFKPLY